MIPNAIALLIVLALVPGLVYFHRAATRRTSAAKSAFVEALEFVAAGTATTLVVLWIWTLVPPVLYSPVLMSPAELADGSKLYDRLPAVLLTTILIVVVACGLAFILSLIAFRGAPRFMPGVSSWTAVFGGRPVGTFVYLGVEVDEGTLIEGRLVQYTAGIEDAQRDLTLAQPIFVTRGGERHRFAFDRLLVNERRVRLITVRYIEKDQAAIRAPSGS